MTRAIVNYKKSVQQIYLPPHGNKYWKFEDLIGHGNIRYFSFGRNALVEGLAAAGVGKGDKILIPGFICREVLSAINSIGAVPTYYKVDKNLKMYEAPENLPHVKAILFVNYFGFPQNLSSFRKYCNRTGAILIEDNAHGLFSQDDDGRYLGTRGDIGIFSLRKTIPMPDGAALVVNNPDIAYKLKPQIPFNAKYEPASFKIKQGLRRLVPLIGATSVQSVTSCIRFFRKLLTGYEIYPSMSNDEYILPDQVAPCANLFSYLSAVDIVEEKGRRRELYNWIDTLLKHLDCEPVFKTFPDYVVPYCYPFYAGHSKISKIKKLLNKQSLQCFQWPDLPKAVEPIAPEHYRNMWLVQFLW